MLGIFTYFEFLEFRGGTLGGGWGGGGSYFLLQQSSSPQGCREAPDKTRLTDFILNLVGNVRYFVEQRQTLVHPLLDHAQVGHHLGSEKETKCPSENPTSWKGLDCIYLKHMEVG